jgi:crotonobetainyl-CoA:carnitine CoA-transferase CaiB-like acyl-CoA transferase
MRVVSLALNLPGPAALMRLRALGAECTKVDPPTGDPMALYCPAAHTDLHQGVSSVVLDLKRAEGQQGLHDRLASADVLLTSFRPSALKKLGLSWADLHPRYPQLVVVDIVGAPGALAEDPGHDLTYLADNGLVPDLALPATLYADMAGALLTTEAVLRGLMQRQHTGSGQHLQVALSDAAAWLAHPRHWGLTTPEGDVGGAHAGYRVYPCQDGRVALAALEPHFARRLCEVAGLPHDTPMRSADTREALARFLASRTRAQLQSLATAHDLPLSVLA